MKYSFFAAAMIAILCLILAGNYPELLYYWSALMLLVSFLYTKKEYGSYSLISCIFFIAYTCFITWERTRSYKFSRETELRINDAEHMIFALVVCLIVALYLTIVFSLKASFGKTLLITVIAFNLIGIVNEYFQNIINNRTFTVLTADSQKDLLMNVAGTAIFIVAAYVYHFGKRRFPVRQAG